MPFPLSTIIASMKLALMVPLVILGLILLATPALPLGLALIVLGVWIFERSRLPNGDGLITILVVVGGLGACAIVVQFAWQRITALL
jgi:hypothetical protein